MKSRAEGGARTRGDRGPVAPPGRPAGGPQQAVLGLQKAAGNRGTGALLEGTGPATSIDAAADHSWAAAGLDPALRSTLETRFQEGFSGVRIRTDLSPALAAQGVTAVTSGDDVTIAPSVLGGAQGLHVLAHELTHVVQGRRNGVLPSAPGDTAKALRGHAHDPREYEADAAAGAALRGETVSVGAGAPVAAQQFDVAEWWEGKKKAAREAASDAGDAFMSSKVVNSIADGVEFTGTEAKNAVFGVGEAVMDPAGSKAALESFVHIKEEENNEQADAWAAQYKDDTVLGPLARANAEVQKKQFEFTAGFLQAATEFGFAAPVAVTHPVETLEGVSELVSTIDPVALLGKAASDVITDAIVDRPEGEKSSTEKTWDKKKAMVGALFDGYTHSVERGKYMEAAGRLVFDVASFVLPGGAATKPVSAAEKTLAVSEKLVVTGEKSLATAEKVLATGEKALAPAEKIAGTGEKAASAIEQTTAAADEAAGAANRATSLWDDIKSHLVKVEERAPANDVDLPATPKSQPEPIQVDDLPVAANDAAELEMKATGTDAARPDPVAMSGRRSRRPHRDAARSGPSAPDFERGRRLPTARDLMEGPASLSEHIDELGDFSKVDEKVTTRGKDKPLTDRQAIAESGKAMEPVKLKELQAANPALEVIPNRRFPDWVRQIFPTKKRLKGQSLPGPDGMTIDPAKKELVFYDSAARPGAEHVGKSRGYGQKIRENLPGDLKDYTVKVVETYWEAGRKKTRVRLDD